MIGFRILVLLIFLFVQLPVNHKLNENQKMECLTQSIKNNWIGLFPDKIKEKKPQKFGSMNVSNIPNYDFDNIPDPLKDFK